MTTNDELIERQRSEMDVPALRKRITELETELSSMVDQHILMRRDERITELEAERPPCDGGCNYNSGPEETCSLHGRKTAEVWEIVSKIGAERDELRETLTKECAELAATTVHTAAAVGASRMSIGSEMVKLGYAGLREQRDKLAATIESAKDYMDKAQMPVTAIATVTSVELILDSADTSTAVQAIRADAWDNGWVAAYGQAGNYETILNPHNGLPGDDAHDRIASRRSGATDRTSSVSSSNQLDEETR